MDEDNHVTLSFGTIIVSNGGLHITPEGFCSIIIYEHEINYGGTTLNSFKMELNQTDLIDLINCLERWEKQFHTIKFVKKEEEK